ncbi:Calx-beta domain-containing protein [Paludisphaera mucosa]|uniref:Calx-beta domain-containing protein n=1 Tax=Paludisphaera mucosa TaxID=3030827 RepID=A0ABT6FJE5_9BACT|nr:Calx-beta domain-containing protein [Paludisphaera mucosa]MDG3007510.1 Calx-beta domain-containing protein [Paludisphaera mucosa]
MPRRRPRPRAFAPEILEARRLLAYVPGPVFAIDQATAGDQSGARTAVDLRGRVIVAWEAGDGSGRGVYARRFESGGAPLGDAFRLNDATAGDQVSPRIAVDRSGAIVVAWWSDSQLDFRRYDRDGTPIGGVQALPGTEGFSPRFELAGVDADGFLIYAEGFQFRWYTLDGTLESARTLDPTSEGWTAVESTAPDRVKWSNLAFYATVTWTDVRARQEGATTVYDVQIMQASIHARELSGGAPSVVATESGLADADLANGLNPWILTDSGAKFIAWRDRASFGPVIRLKEPAYPDWPVQEFGDATDGTPTTIAPGLFPNAFMVHFVRPGEAGPDASYYRLWTTYHFKQTHTYWVPYGSPTPTPDVPPGSFDSLSIIATSGSDFWFLHRSPAGELLAQRYYADEIASKIGFVAYTPDVGESDGEAVVWLHRGGDLSQPATIAYAAVEDRYQTFYRVGLAGYDFTPVTGEVVFEPGRSEASFVVPILDDDVPDGDKTVRLLIGAPGTSPDGWTTYNLLKILDKDDPARRDLAFFDYGAAGLWTWNQVEGWRKINDVDPVQVLATSDREAFVDFGAAGLWRWDALRSWVKLNDLAPEHMADGVDSTSSSPSIPRHSLFLDYGPQGLWSWSELRGWAKLNDADPVRMIADEQALFLDFGPAGLWAWQETNRYTFISPDVPQAMTSLDGRLYLDYGPAGLWRWQAGAPNWIKINGADPEAMAVGADGLFVDYGPYGLWRWDATNGMAPLSGDDPSTLAVAQGGLFAAFARGGLRLWTPAGGWAPLNDVAPAAIATSPNVDDAILDYGPAGLWRWSPASGWRKINDVSPRAVARM